MPKRVNKKQFGFSLVEVILAVGLFGLFSTALIGLLLSTYGGSIQANDRNVATLYAQQGIEAVWSIRRQGWNLLDNGQHGLISSGGYWEFFGTQDFIEPKFIRKTVIENVCRDVSNSIVSCSDVGAIIDLRTKKVVVTVYYDSFLGISQEVLVSAYLTFWQNKRWLQTDWSGGPGQNIWSNASLFESDNGGIDYASIGEIKLVSSGGNVCANRVWPFDNPGEYNYDSNKIEVSSGTAKLKTSSSSGSSTNPSFDTNSTGWTYYDWSQDPGDPDATGTWYGSGGNPGGFVDVNLPYNLKNKILGGYWQQAITISAPATSATCAVDWEAISLTLPNPGVDSLYLAIYLENVSGPPSTSPIAQRNFTTTFTWENVSQSCTSALSSAGTYYYKIAVYLDAKNQNTGPIRVGFDNASVTWNSGSGYPTDRPSIYPANSSVADSVDTWSSFSEVATKNGGEIYYQLSDDDGSSWQYWNGSSWASAGSSYYNIASTINSNIGTFSTSTGKIMFKAFLASDGTQEVVLDSVRVGFSKQPGSGSGFSPFGYLISSAFDMSTSSAVSIIEWDETVPVCSPACDIRFQVRGADDSGGAPGAWSGWYGFSGLNTYYTTSTGSILNTALNMKRWLQYRVELIGDTLQTPSLQEVRIDYLP